MDATEIATLKALMAWEGQRTAPPEGFPALPDLAAGLYTDPAFFALEREHVFRKSWLFAAHIDEIPEPGCTMRWDNAGEPLIIVHGADGVVRAFYNTCRHRGAPVVTQARCKAQRLVCGYHNWTYKTDGSLVGMPEARDFAALDRATRGLIPVRCERLGTCIFVNFDDDAMTLAEWLGPIADEWAEFAFDRLKLGARYSFDLNCNWKVAMEANMEVYHVPFIHPETVATLVDSRRNFNAFYPNGHARMLAPAPDDGDRAVMRAVSVPQNWRANPHVGELGRDCTQSYTLFPNWVSPLSDWFVPPLLFWPTSPTTCRLELITMAPPWDEGPAPDLWTIPDATQPNGRRMSPIIEEDTQFGDAIQRAMESSGFRSVPLGYQEARIYWFHQAIDAMIGASRVPAHLRVDPVLDDRWIGDADPRRAALARAS